MFVIGLFVFLQLTSLAISKTDKTNAKLEAEHLKFSKTKDIDKWNKYKLPPRNKDVRESQVPYVAYIRLKSAPERNCAGSLLSEQWILTTAYCLSCSEGKKKRCSPADFLVEAGSRLAKTPRRQTAMGKEIVKHPSYSARSVIRGRFSANNLGLLKVNRPFKFDKYVSPLAVIKYHAAGHDDCFTFTANSSAVTRQDNLLFLTINCVYPCYRVGKDSIKHNFKSRSYLCPYIDNNTSTTESEIGLPMICDGFQVAVLLGNEFLRSDYGYIMIYMCLHEYVDWIRDVCSL